MKAKWLKKGFKRNILENDFKKTTLYEKPLRLTQKQIKSNIFVWKWKMGKKMLFQLIWIKENRFLV